MQVDSDFEIIKLDPNVIYESDDGEDSAMEEGEEEQPNIASDNENWSGENVFVVGENKTVGENKQMMNDEDDLANKEPCVQSVVTLSEPSPVQKPRKKLNLAEYKIIRANRPAPTFDDSEMNVVLELCETPETLPPIQLPTDPRSIKALLAQQNQCQHQPSIIVDGNSQNPIHLAEMCIEVEQMKDSNEETQEKGEEEENVENNQIDENMEDYEEIVLVSMECNTEISISPLENDNLHESPTKFLTNIVNTIQNNDNVKTLLNSSTTLLSSINAVVHEKCSNSVIEAEQSGRKNASEHGENKVIMHLRKDRIRPEREDFAIQTDSSPLFPPLILSPSLIFNRIKNIRNSRRRVSRSSRSRSHSRSRSRSFTPDTDYYKRATYKYPRSLYSSTVNSSEFDSSSESDSSAYSSCRSSDYDSVRKFDNRFKQGYRNNQRQNVVMEERRVVYVGGLHENTTKDELRRKFIKYGTIKKISTHEKNEGALRFGFITFADASAAYEVLDKFKSDDTLSMFDIRFGGRRNFCKQTYADLDSLPNENDIDMYNNNSSSSNGSKQKSGELSFEDLLNLAKRKLCKQK